MSKCNKCHEIGKIMFNEKMMILNVDEKQYTFQLSAISKKLASASHIEREIGLVPL